MLQHQHLKEQIQSHEIVTEVALQILVYSSSSGENSERLLNQLTSLIPLQDLEIYRTIADMANRLRKPSPETIVAILLAADQADLLEMLSIRELLVDTNLILIVPDSTKRTIAKAHSLRPRFITYADSEFREAVAVVKKIVSNKTQGVKKAESAVAN